MSKGKYKLEGIIKNVSPLIISSGTDENCNSDLLKDKEGRFFIPATSLTGVFRDAFADYLGKTKAEEIFGSDDKNNPKQSRLIICDAYPKNGQQIKIRDGVRINERGMSEDKAKFDFEILEPGAEFRLQIFADKTDDIKNYLLIIKDMLNCGVLRIGAKTNSGFGKIEYTDGKLTEYDFSDKSGLFKWLNGKEGIEVTDKKDFNKKNFNKKNYDFTLDGEFSIKTSLIIKSYPADTSAPDAVHIKSNGKPVIPGTSIKGAVRARIKKILNTICDDEGKNEEIIKELFGYVRTERGGSNDSSAKGRILFEESVVLETEERIQRRVRLNRFTGGAAESALFESMPLFSARENTINIKTGIRIRDCKDYEAGLMLLVLKDLWTGDLAVGGEKNAGRGVLQGIKADVTFKGKTYSISEYSLPADELNVYIYALHDYLKNNKQEEKNGK